ncbi:MAG: hypothetical protein KGJ37_06915 [Verrucomicrobiota bacterium]|nr:hypothetical protein [Verrucomicrobiota bacterium]
MRFFSLLILFAAPIFLPAAPISLGQGLAFERVHKLPADLPTSGPAKKEAVILDLRYVQTDDAGAAAFSAWLSFRTTSLPAFILVNTKTSPLLVRALKARPEPPGVVTLGPALADFTPDIALKISPDVEQRAYNAFEHGASLDSLITEKVDKRRYDESALVKAHVSDTQAQPEEDEPAAAKPKSPPPLVDLTLQRAVQLHRALLALHKLPSA